MTTPYFAAVRQELQRLGISEAAIKALEHAVTLAVNANSASSTSSTDITTLQSDVTTLQTDVAAAQAAADDAMLLHPNTGLSPADVQNLIQSSSIWFGTAPPTDTAKYPFWWDTTSGAGRLKVYYTDANSSQWVDASPAIPGPTGATGATGATGPQGATGATGPAGGDVTLISRVTPSATGVVSFTSLGAYKHLKIRAQGRGTAAATSVIVQMTFNSDTAANYDNQRAYGTGTGATASNANGAASSYVYVADLTAASATASVASAFEVEIFDYADTTFQKTAIGHYNLKVSTATTGQYIFMVGGFWRNTAAITRIDLTLSSGNFASGSSVSLYGIN